ncbi:lysylphosphatidylglycerol synthase transmembrane domain-containing protein [Azospirillum agricola]|uniref:lysylphosphatidylglycerol synthase transmembrane domain-containing protein n=1 Tax=Azospirillum agricola TaxID=1720247 RepID=UPI000A0F113E|nr:lysylphosphatidylglycerol synthase transmembrane domain-containing protein [Azospirillum agricola]SMH41342.1 hypothetical protein SAMN02982994_1711 [Azospirillum lipoferum]
MPPPGASTTGALLAWRNRLLAVTKIGVTVGILALLLGQADWEKLAGRLAHAAPDLLLLGFVVKAMTIPFAAERWRMIGRSVGVVMSAGLSLRVMMASLFFGQLLPGALGGDIVRGWLTWRSGHSPSAVATALVLDRLAALAGVVVLIIAGLPRLLSVVPWPVASTVLAMSGMLAVGMAAFTQLDRVPWLARHPHALMGRLLSLAAGLRGALTHRSALVALGHSIAVHLCTIAATIIFAQALSIPIRPLDALVIMPFTITAMALPISLAGWGVREGSMVAGFALFGVAGEDALLVSLLIGLSVTLMALPGGLVWLSLPKRANGAAGGSPFSWLRGNKPSTSAQGLPERERVR